MGVDAYRLHPVHPGQLAAGDDGVALIIERARKNLVDVAFENLKTFSSINTTWNCTAKDVS
jgi:hypothetical protein